MMKNGICFLDLPHPRPAPTVGVCSKPAAGWRRKLLWQAVGLPPARQPPQQWVDTFRSFMLRCNSCKGEPQFSATFFAKGYAEPGLFSNVFMLPL